MTGAQVDPVLRRVEFLESVMISSAQSGWKPREVQQQQALALLQHVAAPVRKIAFDSFFGRSACDKCEQVAAIQRVAIGWDLQLWCSTPECSSFDQPLLNIEFKPWGAPPHYSVAGLNVWQRRKKEKSLIVTTETPFPTEECSTSGCTKDCLHSSYRSKPTLPQVIAADPDGVAKLVLTDLPGDLSTVFGTRGWGYTIAGADILHIAEGIGHVTEALEPWATGGRLSDWDRRLLVLVITALWVRTPPKDFRDLTESNRVRPWLEAKLLPLADEWVVAHPREP